MWRMYDALRPSHNSFLFNKYSSKIFRNIFYFIIAYCIYMHTGNIFPASFISVNCSLLSKCPCHKLYKFSIFIMMICSSRARQALIKRIFATIFATLEPAPIKPLRSLSGKSRIHRAFSSGLRLIFLPSESVIIPFSFTHYMSVRFFTLTDCLYIAVALQRCVDDSFSRNGFIGSQNYRFSAFLHLESNSSFCKVFQSFFTASPVIFCIKFYSRI